MSGFLPFETFQIYFVMTVDIGEVGPDWDTAVWEGSMTLDEEYEADLDKVMEEYIALLEEV